MSGSARPAVAMISSIRTARNATNLDNDVSRLAGRRRCVADRVATARPGAVALARRPAGVLQVAQVAERLGQPPVGERRASAPRRGSAGRARSPSRAPSRARRARRADSASTRSRLAAMWPGDVGERPPVAGHAQPRVERLDDIERVQELADRIRREAVVEVERDASQQVVAGDQQPVARAGAGRHARGRVPASRTPRHGPRSVSNDDAVDQLPVRLRRPRRRRIRSRGDALGIRAPARPR